MNVLYSQLFTDADGGSAMYDNSVMVGRYLGSLCNLHALVSDDHVSDVMGVSSDRSFSFGFRIRDIASYSELRKLRMLRHYVDEHAIQVVFCQPHWRDLFTWNYFNDLPIVAYVHDPIPHPGHSMIDKMRDDALGRKQLGRANRIVVSSEAMKRAYIEVNKVDESFVEVIRLGLLDNLVFDGIDSSQIAYDVLFFGALLPYKGIDVLLNAAAKLPERSFAIVGRGDLMTYCCGGGLPGNVFHQNQYLPDRDLASLVASSRIVVMPYSHATGSQVSQTANYYGKPVIATNVGGLPEYVVDGINGMIIPPNNPSVLADAIEHLLDSPALYSTLSVSAKRYCESNFSAKALGNKYIDCIRHVLAS